jgi:hypothetical protein
MRLWPTAVFYAALGCGRAWAACAGPPYDQFDFWLGAWHEPPGASGRALRGKAHRRRPAGTARSRASASPVGTVIGNNGASFRPTRTGVRLPK